MTTESREYPTRIWAGHLGGGRRIWKPELLHESEKAFACEYIRADAVEVMRKALVAAENFIAGFDGDEMQDGIDGKLSEIREAIALVDEAQSKEATHGRD